MAPEVSGMVTLSRQANQIGAVLPSERIMMACFDSHHVNITCTQSIHDSIQVTC
jgi:hypothetical protein